MSRERRRAERFPSRLFIELQSDVSSDGPRNRGVVVDVSQLGLAVETEADLDMNKVYHCHVEMPFALSAKVVRRYSSGHVKKYGLEFSGQGFLDKLLMKKLLKGSRITRKI